jgi:uncharacterized protein YggE
MTRFASRLALAVTTALAASSLVACAAAPPQVHVHTDKAPDPGHLVVTGSATLQVSPDCADLTMTMSARSMKPGEAVNEVHAKQAALLAALHKLEVADADLKLSTLSIQPEYEYTFGQNVLKGYNARVTITVTTKKFDQIGALMEAGGNAGVTEMSSQFRRSNLDELKKQVRDMALQAARDKAKQTATALGIVLGTVTGVSEESSGYLYSNAYFPSNSSGSVNDSPATLAAEMQPLQLQISVTYELPGSRHDV